MTQELVNSRPPIVPFSNLGDLLRRRVEEYCDRPWLIFYSDKTGRHEYSYADFFRRVCDTAAFLAIASIGKGDCVATVAYNHADTVMHYFAAWTIGAVVVPVNLGEDDKRIGYILENSR